MVRHVSQHIDISSSVAVAQGPTRMHAVQTGLNAVTVIGVPQPPQAVMADTGGLGGWPVTIDAKAIEQAMVHGSRNGRR